jgi:hypothetical protein
VLIQINLVIGASKKYAITMDAKMKRKPKFMESNKY